MSNKVDKDVPVPGTTRQRKYPFVDMEPGQSAFFKEKVGGRAYKAANAVGYRYERVYIARRENDGIRIWRKV